MNIRDENIEGIEILCKRLNCILKSLSFNKFDKNEQTIMKNLAKEIAYNINVETSNFIELD